MPQVQFGPLLLLLLTLVTASCDDPPLSSSITRSATSPGPVLNVAGIWSGTAIDSSGQLLMTWQLTQEGASVSGVMRAFTNVGLHVYTGSVSGRLAAGTLAFSAIVPRGGITELPDCTLELTGSATDVQPTSMAGTYTGAHSCLGAVEGGRFIFIKQ